MKPLFLAALVSFILVACGVKGNPVPYVEWQKQEEAKKAGQTQKP